MAAWSVMRLQPELSSKRAVDPGTAYMQGDDLLFARVKSSLITDAEGLMPDLIDTQLLPESSLQKQSQDSGLSEYLGM